MVTLQSAESYKIKFSKIDNSIKEKIIKLVKKLLENHDIGKPMRYERKGTREVYVNPFRLSYHYDKGLDTMTLLDIYHKDEQ